MSEPERWHTFPLDDVIEHNTDGPDCICYPERRVTELEDGERVEQIIHRRLRDLHEPPAR